MPKLKQADLEKEIVKLAKEGNSPTKIGIILRDKHGIPKAKTTLGKKIEKVLKENKVDYKTQKKLAQDKEEKIRKHLSKNKHDYTASRALTKQLWQVKKHSN